MTERDVLDLLQQRYTVDRGNGPRYVFAEHVKSLAGHAPGKPHGVPVMRCADFIAMDLYPANGLALHGHEVKVSRSDWLAEMRQPEEADAFRPYMDHWSLVVADRAIVRSGELPPFWGLMAPGADGRLRVYQGAPRAIPEPLPRTMLAALLRSTVRTAVRNAEKGSKR